MPLPVVVQSLSYSNLIQFEASLFVYGVDVKKKEKSVMVSATPPYCNDGNAKSAETALP